jgi:3-oxoacyl-[acyl-carrier-protein] synthase II
MRALITGMGCITPLGQSVPEFERRLFAGECGLAPVERFPTEGLRNDLAGEVRPLPVPPSWAAVDSLTSPDLLFLACAVDQALAAAALGSGPLQMGIVLSTNFAGSSELDRAFGLSGATPKLEAWSFDAGIPLLVGGLDISGPALTLSISCASGTSAVALAADWIRAGRADAVIVGGYDALSLYVLSGLSILRTVSTDTCRPFDRNRSGTIFAEGAAALVIESDERAAERGARVYAEILGGADTNNAYHLTAPDKEGEGIELCVRRAIERAEVAPEEIDYVNAHGTATLYHDVTEVRALKAALGSRAYEIPVSSIKGACGHMMGAAGTIEVVASVLAMERQEAPPTVNLVTPDPECDLDHLPGCSRAATVRTVLTNSAGIGGSNASLLLRGGPR